MTREEAITQLDLLLEYCESMMTSEYPVWRRDCEALQMLIAALRPISREQVEKVWRGEWMGSADGYADGELVYDTWECSHCGYVIDEEDDPDMLPQFCPKCYAAMTDEAMQMVMKRLEAVYEQDND